MKKTGNSVEKLQEAHEKLTAPPAETWAGGYHPDSWLRALTEQVPLTENPTTPQTKLEV